MKETGNYIMVCGEKVVVYGDDTQSSVNAKVQSVIDERLSRGQIAIELDRNRPMNMDVSGDE